MLELITSYLLRISHLSPQMNGTSLKTFFLRTSLVLPVDFTIPSFVHPRASYKSLLQLTEHDYSLLWGGVGHHGFNTKSGIKNRSRASSCVFPVAGSLFVCFESFPYSVTLSNDIFAIIQLLQEKPDTLFIIEVKEFALEHAGVQILLHYLVAMLTGASCLIFLYLSYQLVINLHQICMGNVNELDIFVLIDGFIILLFGKANISISFFQHSYIFPRLFLSN